jgi:hypothetical protein
MTIQARTLQPRLVVAKLQHVKQPKSVHAVCRFSCLSLFHFLDCTQTALRALGPNPQGEEQQGQPECKCTHRRVGSRASQLHTKVGRAIEYVGTKVMDPQDHGHHPGPMTLMGCAQFARRFTGPNRIRKRNLGGFSAERNQSDPDKSYRNMAFGGGVVRRNPTFRESRFSSGIRFGK